MKWFEIQVLYSEEFKRHSSWSETYRLKRECFLPLLDRYEIVNFLTLDEPEFVLFRVEVEEENIEGIKGDIQEFLDNDPKFSTIKIVEWSPEEDARARILSAKQRAIDCGVTFPGGVPEEGWKIVGFEQTTRRWHGGPDDLERKVAEFSRFMARVNGQFTRAYLKEIENCVDDPWMLSVFIHLLLDSISIWQNQEKMARAFPFI
jgi:hypothetical protein